MNLSNLITGAVAVAVSVILVGAFFVPQDGRNGRDGIGGSAGPTHFEHQQFLQNISVGGDTVATSSTAGTYTLTTAELDANRRTNFLSWTVNTDVTLTTMASSAAPFAGMAVGETYDVYFYNASTTAASAATFAAGSGVDMQEDEGGSVVVNGLELAKLTFIKKADTDVVMLVEPYQVGD